MHKKTIGAWVLAILIVLALSLVAAPDAAAEGFAVKNFHYFRPAADGSGILFTHGSESLSWLGMHYGGYIDDSIDPLQVNFDNGDEERLVENQVAVNALYSIGLTRFANLGVAVPVVAYRTINSEFDDEDIPTTLVEDLRFEAKGILFDRRRRCYGLALNLTGTVPVDARDNSFATDGEFGLTARLIADLGRTWWTVALNSGYVYNPGADSGELKMETGDELLTSLGATFRLRQYGSILVDTAFRSPLDGLFTNENTSYGEAAVAYRYFLGNFTPVALTVGGAAGLIDGAGSPLARVFIGVTVYENRLKRGR
ncbi:MAG: hypothetical protein P9M14_06335 [Candidatus Alcyoniella australis]|nr:hypothetical protein [Candidatus Alcyoniella australis]